MAYPKKLLSSDEVIVSEFRPHWSGILREGLLVIGLLIVIGFVLANGWNGWIALALLVVGLALTARGFIRWATTNHVITNERVIYRAGLVAKNGKEIPHEVINDVSFSQTFFERLFGTGDLLIESAGTHGQSRYQDIPRPEEIQSLIYAEREKRMTSLNVAGMTGGTFSKSVAEQLEMISRLHDDGKLTDEEFSAQKAKLLGGE